MSVCFHCLFFRVPGITRPELHLLENRDHVDDFQEIKFGGKTSGVITYTVEQVRVLRLKNLMQNLRTSRILKSVSKVLSHKL